MTGKMDDISKQRRRRRTWRRLSAALGLAALGCMAMFGGPVLAGGTLDLGAYKGKVVYLDFWASWCHPCEQSFPYMEQLKQRYGDDLVVIAVNVDHSRDRADAFLNRMHSDLNVVYDPDGQLAAHYDVKDMPTSMLIGRDGKVRYVHKGFFAEQMSGYNAQVAELVHAH